MESRRAAAGRGPVAQLGARVNGIHEVTGSNPVWSTTLSSNPPQRQYAVKSRQYAVKSR